METATSTSPLARASALVGKVWRDHARYSSGVHALSVLVGIVFGVAALVGAVREGPVMVRVLLAIAVPPLAFVVGYVTFFYRFGGHGAPREGLLDRRPVRQQYVIVGSLIAVVVVVVLFELVFAR